MRKSADAQLENERQQAKELLQQKINVYHD